MAHIEVSVSGLQQQHDAIRQVRSSVFLIEQAIPPELEYDDRDPICRHAVVYLDYQPVATGRIDLPLGGKIGRVAVLKPFRRQGLGRQVMQGLEQEAIASGLERVWFHSQVPAMPFYFSLGYQGIGEEFMEADIPHRKMEKNLRD